jgi:hypothetical protein
MPIDLDQTTQHLEDELAQLNNKYPGPTKEAETEFLAKLNQLKQNPYNLKITFPDHGGRKKFLSKLNKLQKQLNFSSKYELITSLVESACCDLGID